MPAPMSKEETMTMLPPAGMVHDWSDPIGFTQAGRTWVRYTCQRCQQQYEAQEGSALIIKALLAATCGLDTLAPPKSAHEWYNGSTKGLNHASYRCVRA